MCVLRVFKVSLIFTSILQLAVCMTADLTQQDSDTEYLSDSDSYESWMITDFSELIKFHEDHPDTSSSFSQELEALETSECSLNNLELWKDLKDLADKDQTFACLFEKLLDKHMKCTRANQSGNSFKKAKHARTYRNMRTCPTISSGEQSHRSMDVIVIDDSD